VETIGRGIFQGDIPEFACMRLGKVQKFSRYSVFQPKFEPDISQVQARNITA
jgi:hypothetical protein